MNHLCFAILATAFLLHAQSFEPILTKSAVPVPTGAASIKLDYAGGLGQGGGASQVIPEGTLEAGIYPDWEIELRFPLLRVREPGGVVIGGGQLAFGARYNLLGGQDALMQSPRRHLSKHPRETRAWLAMPRR